MKIFVRVDWNCPKNSYKKIKETEDFLLRIKHHTVIIATHYSGSTKKLLQHTTLPITYHDNFFVSQINTPGLHLLPNLRDDKGEEENDTFFAQQLTADCDLYINNAWGSVHRQHASIDKASHNLRAIMGPLIQAERAQCESFKQATFIVGGAKLDKLYTVLDLLKAGKKVVIAGALIVPILQTKGLCMGAPNMKEVCEEILEYDPILPIDYVVAPDHDKEGIIVHTHEIPHGYQIFDIGPETIELIVHSVGDTVVWNGPVGYTPSTFYQRGTIELARRLHDTKVLVCGGDTTGFFEKFHWTKFTHSTTAGGAVLAMMTNKKMEWITNLQPFSPELVFGR